MKISISERVGSERVGSERVGRERLHFGVIYFTKNTKEERTKSMKV